MMITKCVGHPTHPKNLRSGGKYKNWGLRRHCFTECIIICHALYIKHSTNGDVFWSFP